MAISLCSVHSQLSKPTNQRERSVKIKPTTSTPSNRSQSVQELSTSEQVDPSIQDTLVEEAAEVAWQQDVGESGESRQQMTQLAGTHVPDLPPDLLSSAEESTGKTLGVSAFGLLQQVSKVEAGQREMAPMYAAIDMGSNSAKMLILQQQPDGSMKTVKDHRIGTRLGKDVEVGDPLPEANQQRAMDALQEFLQEAEAFGITPSEIGVITTAAVRNSSNGEEFIQRLQNDLGLEQAQILTGEQEAETGYLGTIDAFRKDKEIPSDARFATLDLGGGSFQLAVGTKDSVEQGESTQIGSNYILDNVFPANANTLTSDDFAHVDQVLQDVAPMPLSADTLQDRTLVATGGVSKFLRAHFGKDTITRQEIDSLRRDIGSVPEGERLAVIQQGKDESTQRALGVDTESGALDYGKKLPASASLLLHIMNQLGLEEVSVSTTDSRHAIINSLV